MDFFANLGSMAYKPIKAGSDALSQYMQPDTPYTNGVLSGAITEADKKGVLPSATGLLMQQYQPGQDTVLKKLPNTQQLGQGAVSGAPVYLDSSEKTVISPEKEDKDGSKFDLQRFGAMLQGIQGSPTPQMSQVSSGRVGGGGPGFNPNLYKNPLIEREFQNLYMAPLYTQLGGK